MRRRKQTSSDVVVDALNGGNVEMGGVYVEKNLNGELAVLKNNIINDERGSGSFNRNAFLQKG